MITFQILITSCQAYHEFITNPNCEPHRKHNRDIRDNNCPPHCRTQTATVNVGTQNVSESATKKQWQGRHIEQHKIMRLNTGANYYL